MQGKRNEEVKIKNGFHAVPLEFFTEASASFEEDKNFGNIIMSNQMSINMDF